MFLQSKQSIGLSLSSIISQTFNFQLKYKHFNFPASENAHLQMKKIKKKKQS